METRRLKTVETQTAQPPSGTKTTTKNHSVLIILSKFYAPWALFSPPAALENTEFIENYQAE